MSSKQPPDTDADQRVAELLGELREPCFWQAYSGGDCRQQVTVRFVWDSACKCGPASTFFCAEHGKAMAALLPRYGGVASCFFCCAAARFVRTEPVR